MQIKEEDILQQTHGLIIHGCNAQGVMGSGLAAQIRAKYPIVYEQYKNIPTGESSLGAFQAVKVGENLYIGNCITQLFYGKDGKKYADIRAIRKALDSVFFWCDIMDQPLHAPEIGCGLGGLAWEEVSKVFEEMAEKYPSVNITLYRLKK